MNILKPQNLHIQELENKYLVHIKEDEKINYCRKTLCSKKYC